MKESAPCRICGSPDTEAGFPEAENLELRKCRKCGIIFRPENLDPETYYDENYYLDAWPGSLGRFFKDFDPQKHHKTRFFMRQLAELESVLGGPGRLLDVGCANGVFVWLAEKRGWRATGVDVSSFAVEWGKKQFSVDLKTGTIHDLPPEPVFDVITFWDTLEHLPDPAAALSAAGKRLREGGFVVILTPDCSSLVNQLVHLAWRAAPRAGAPYLEKLYHQDHLTFFDRRSLARAVMEQGFEIHWVQGYDEAPEDTETRGWLRAAVALVRAAAFTTGKQHEVLLWARKPEGDTKKEGILPLR